jgi:hypothetical protein
MRKMGFESKIPVFERAKTGHALDRAATMIGTLTSYPHIFQEELRAIYARALLLV